MSAHVPIPDNLYRPSIALLAGVDITSIGTEDGELYVDTDQATLDAAMEDYYGDEETYIWIPSRKFKKRGISNQVYKFISNRYSIQIQQMLQALLTEASIGGLTNRITYIQQLLDWIKTVVSANLLADDEIDTAVTIAEINAVSVDLAPFEATDPAITIKETMEIPD